MQDAFDGIRKYVRPEDVYLRLDAATFKRITAKIFNAQKQSLKNTGKKIRFLVLVDDCAGSNAIHGNRQSPFAHLAVQTTHWSMTLIVITQNPTSVSPSFRENAENVAIFPSEGELEYQWLRRTYQSLAMEEDLMKKIITTAWKGGKRDNAEWGKHFLFIAARPRTHSRFFIDFKQEIRIEGL